ncbi:MAG: type I pullulanase [Clostridiaceae bacterium]|nr:type I pullulanase [Clostridiaceae bacterium]
MISVDNNLLGGKVMYSYAYDFNKIKFVIDENSYFQIIGLQIYNGDKKLSIKDYNIHEKTMEIILNEEINIKKVSSLTHEDKTLTINYFPLFQSEEFNKRFYYENELGLFYSNISSTFKVWSPVASTVTLLIYKSGDTLVSENPHRFKMDESKGVFSIAVKGDLKGMFYSYEVTAFEKTNIAVDPYAKGVGINGERGAIINLEETNPLNWETDTLLFTKSYTDAIIYETSIRDISMHPESGITNKGKFLGLTEINTKSTKNISTGLDHIIEMGITHLQLMPFFDFSYTSVDEKNPEKYNWGYDPQNYNVPEGSFATNPYSPKCRIKELKEMIFSLHSKGISINMDVVYNHVAFHNNNNFEKIFPGYYLRRNLDGSFSNGSGCSNDTASEQKMMRKFIIDSVLFWAKEYHLDGFRFDLMGLHDIDTMNLIKENLNSLGRPIMVYGEGWNLDTPIPIVSKAIKANARKTPEISYFNDFIRDLVKGNVFDLYEQGFVSGKGKLESDLKEVISGTPGILLSPEQSINYVSCHDNSTLWDKFQDSNRYDSLTDRMKMVKLSNAIILTSQGVPLLHSGEEFLRTKFGEHNSFNSSDAINALNWDLKYQNQEVVNYYKGLINIRKSHPAFRMTNYHDIQNNLEFLNNMPENVVGYLIKNNANKDTWKTIMVIFNANKYSTWITVPPSPWNLVVNELTAGLESIKLIDSDRIEVPGISMYLAYSL